MESSKSLMDEDWDYLLVLDACRYDYFEKVYDDYFEGKLEKIVSPGTETSEWCRKVFSDKYDDVVYVSGNPRINSRGEVMGFNASNHFHRVIDVWDLGWDDEEGTTHPSSINKAVLKTVPKFPEKRTIAYYMQPHGPYIESDFDSRESTPGSVNPDIKSSKSWQLAQKIVDFIGQKWTWKIRNWIGIPPSSPIYSAYQSLGKDGLQDIYEKNLRIVLEHMRELSEKLKGANVIITSDHGELLGEDGKFGHPSSVRTPILFEVPFFRVQETKEEGATMKFSERDRLKDKIGELKQSGEI